MSRKNTIGPGKILRCFFFYDVYQNFQTHVALITIEKTCRLTIRAWKWCRCCERIRHFSLFSCCLVNLVYFVYIYNIYIYFFFFLIQTNFSSIRKMMLWWHAGLYYTTQFTICVSVYSKACSNFKICFFSNDSFRNTSGCVKMSASCGLT